MARFHSSSFQFLLALFFAVLYQPVHADLIIQNAQCYPCEPRGNREIGAYAWGSGGLRQFGTAKIRILPAAGLGSRANITMLDKAYLYIQHYSTLDLFTGNLFMGENSRLFLFRHSTFQLPKKPYPYTVVFDKEANLYGKHADRFGIYDELKFEHNVYLGVRARFAYDIHSFVQLQGNFGQPNVNFGAGSLTEIGQSGHFQVHSPFALGENVVLVTGRRSEFITTNGSATFAQQDGHLVTGDESVFNNFGSFFLQTRGSVALAGQATFVNRGSVGVWGYQRKDNNQKQQKQQLYIGNSSQVVVETSGSLNLAVGSQLWLGSNARVQVDAGGKGVSIGAGATVQLGDFAELQNAGGTLSLGDGGSSSLQLDAQSVMVVPHGGSVGIQTSARLWLMGQVRAEFSGSVELQEGAWVSVREQSQFRVTGYYVQAGGTVMGIGTAAQLTVDGQVSVVNGGRLLVRDNAAIHVGPGIKCVVNGGVAQAVDNQIIKITRVNLKPPPFMACVLL